MKMPNLSACASCFFVESHVAIEAAIEKRAAASEACDSSLRFPLSSDVFILLFQRSVCCLSVPEHASDVSIYFLRPSKNLLTVRSSAIAECFGRRIGIVCFGKDTIGRRQTPPSIANDWNRADATLRIVQKTNFRTHPKPRSVSINGRIANTSCNLKKLFFCHPPTSPCQAFMYKGSCYRRFLITWRTRELKFLNHLSRKAIWSREQTLWWEWMSRRALLSKGFQRCLTNS
jgi:hypothetical protein